MLINRFNYDKLSRTNINGKRHYVDPSGNKLVSVTTILEATKSEEKKLALENWKRRVGHVQAAAITKEAAGRGTRMHAFLENYMHRDSTGDIGTNPFSIQSHSMAKHIIDNGLQHVSEFYGSEVSLYYPSLYAGATDCTASYKGDLAILDFKQTNKPKKDEWIEDYKCQLAAYALAHDELFGTKVKYGIVMMCSPTLIYQEWIITGNELDKYKEIWWNKLEEYYTKKFGV